jgi:predicted urease superfamily metal-dependent hydrolase
MKKEKKLVALTAFLPVLADFIEDLNDQYVFKQTLKRKANILAEEIQKVDRDILRIDVENAGKIFDEQIQLQILFRQWIEEVIELD